MNKLILVVAVMALCAACGRRGSDESNLAILSGLSIGNQIGPTPGNEGPRARTENPYQNDAAARTEGHRLFNWYNCSGCHGGHAGGGMGPSLRDSVWIYGNQPNDIFSSIAQGRANGMPSWGTTIPAEQIWKLVAYIESMGTANEASPPPPLPPTPAPLPPRQ